jgi:pyruvate dehydrogenase E2 component (dihydrolipoamide acetyltransferase)
MPIEVLMPALSPTMKEGNIAKWLKKEGDTVSSGEIIAEIETDKATMEVEAVDEGVLGRILVPEGTENVSVNSLIALILEDGEDAALLENYESANDDPKPSTSEDKKDEKEEKMTVEKNTVSQDDLQEKSDKRIFISPLAKNIAKQNNIDYSQISGNGPKGRIIKNDILQFLEQGGSNKKIGRNPVEYKEVKNGNIRKVIAKRLLESKQNVPHFYLNIEVNLDNLTNIRKQINSAATINCEGKPQYKISVNDLMIKACALALKQVPEANSSWTDEAILFYNNIDISVAVAIDGGLITPIIKNADQKDIINISSEMKNLAKKAKSGTLLPEEFQGGGFSISNLGMFGIKSFNAIVNPPQSCIISIGASQKKPIIAENNQISIGEVAEISLSCDHRSVDGAVGARFLQEFKNIVQNPVLMLL